MPAADATKRLNRRVVFPGVRDVRLVEEPVPVPASGEALLETRCTLISTGTELAHLAGPPWTNPGGIQLPRYPHAAGYCNAAVVAAVGPGEGRWQPGDRVASGARHAAYPLLRASDWAVRIPDGVPDDAAAFCTLAVIALNGCRLGTPQLGEDALVLGMGLLGQLLVQYLRLAGCRRVIAADVAAPRLAIAERIGAATHRLNPRETDGAAAVRDLTDGRGPDLVFEATGRTETYDLAFAAARPYGRVVALGSPRQPAPVDMQQLHIKALRLIGAIASTHPAEGNPDNRWSHTANAALFMMLLAAGQLDVRNLITDRVPAAEAPRAYASLLEDRERHTGVILEWQHQ